MLKETVSCIQVIEATYRMLLKELKEERKKGTLNEPYGRDLYSCVRTLRELVGQALYEMHIGAFDLSITSESQPKRWLSDSELEEIKKRLCAGANGVVPRIDLSAMTKEQIVTYSGGVLRLSETGEVYGSGEFSLDQFLYNISQANSTEAT